MNLEDCFEEIFKEQIPGEIWEELWEERQDKSLEETWNRGLSSLEISEGTLASILEESKEKYW